MNDQWKSVLEIGQRIMNYPLFTVGSRPLTLGGILMLCLLLVLTLIVARILQRLVLSRLLGRTRLQPAIQYAIGKVTSYMVIALGIYVALQTVGIDLSGLAVMAGAVGVGIGLGFQNIVNNFISGLIILAERPISIGDRIEVAGVTGQVRDINLRSTMVVTNDNISVIVPNSEFITQPVLNWSHGDPKVRLRLPFGVAYGSDVDKLRAVTTAMATAHPHVMKEPTPTIFFIGFGDSSLNFELVVWTREMTFNPRRFRSDLYFNLEATLRQHGIEIPFPQRDLHVRSGALVVQQQNIPSATPPGRP